MDRLIQLLGALNIDEGSIQMDELIDQMIEFDVSATRKKVKYDDNVEKCDNEFIDDLCDRFDNVTLDDAGIYLKHVTGKIMFIPYGQCGLMYKMSIGTVTPRWTCAY